MLCNTQGMPEKEEYYYRMAEQNKVDGIICVTYQDVEPYVSENIPLISLDRHFHKKVSCISSDNYHGGELAAQKMISTGSRHLLYLRNGSEISGETLKRGKGFKSYCDAHGVSCETLNLGDDFDLIRGKTSVEEVLRNFIISARKTGKMRYDGIYTSTDLLAKALLEQLQFLGVEVPEEVQLVGHDGIQWMNSGKYLVSTIVQPVSDMARKSVELLLKKIKGEEIETLTILPVKFAEGGTTR